MPLVAPDVSEDRMLQYIVNITTPSLILIRLFVNNLTPDRTTIDSDPTEATEAGYAAIPLPSWTTVDAGAGLLTAEHADVTFTLTESASIYGYWMTNDDGMVWIERFSGAPFTLPSGGGTIVVSPSLTIDGGGG